MVSTSVVKSCNHVMFRLKEQRRQLLVQQQEQRLQMFEAQRRREAVVTVQQQQAGSSHRSPSYSTGGGLHAMLSETAQEGTSRQTGNMQSQGWW